MKRTLIALALVASPCFAQQMVFKGESLTVRLLEQPCTKPVLDLIQEQYHSRFRQAEVVYQNRPLAACWTLQGANVVIVDVDGDSGEIPMAAFTDKEV